ncbi:MAG: divergent polysaccharide deacetylase family protein [Asticcacaulis sp.]
MFAKPKTAASPAPRFQPWARGRAGSGDTLETLKAFAKKPWVPPATAFTTFVVALVAFLNLAGDPDAGAPSVRINLAKAKAAVTSSAIAPDDSASGMQSFTLDSLGMFQDTSVDGFNLSANGDTAAPVSGTAIITLPDGSGYADPSTGAATPTAPASPLAQAPIAGLVQTTNDGPLPIIAPNGTTPSSAYARPFKSDGRPMVALVVGGLGLNPTTTREAIDQLPPQVTLSFVPYTSGLQGWIDLARASGHEVMIEVPMQPSNYPDNDPGPQTLMANARTDDLLAHLNWALSRCTGFFGVSNYQGSAFFKDKAGVSTFMDNLKSRGVAFVDDGSARGMTGAWARASADRIVDNQINATAINAQLAGLEATAKSRGSALGTGFAYPVTLAVAFAWTRSLDAKGIQLAPASALTHQ